MSVRHAGRSALVCHALRALALALLVSASETPARAQTSRAAKEAQARDAFLRGVGHVREERWSEALAEFDRSVADRPHPVTFYNMALCHRALGRPVRAAFALDRALAEEGEERLAEETASAAKRLLTELRARRAFLVLDLTTTDSLLTVDGQPAERLGELLVVALIPGPPSPLPLGKVRLALDPGRHVLRLSREGHAPLVHEELAVAGETRDLPVALRLLPGILAISATVPGARLLLDDHPEGPLPRVFERPGGPHRVEVQKAGYVPFVTEVTLRPGARADVLAELHREKVPLTKQWWFYAGIGAALLAAGATTYALTRPTEKADGGSLGWVVRP